MTPEPALLVAVFLFPFFGFKAIFWAVAFYFLGPYALVFLLSAYFLSLMRRL